MTPPTTISRALAEYLTDWLAWVDRGAPDGDPYDRGVGLCSNASRYKWGLSAEVESIIFPYDKYPFGGAAEYNRRGGQGTQHLNEARLAWVRKTIQTAEIEG